MHLLETEIAPIGMGCWAIGGPFFEGEKPLGFGAVSDAESLRTIDAGWDGGIRLFDTAAVYGAGHSERVVGRALRHRPDAIVVTKIGIGFDETTKQVTGAQVAPEDVVPAIERCLKRLMRDRIDILLLHQNGLPVDQAAALFIEMERARQAGKIRAYGWSTDFPDSAAAMAAQPGFVAVEHAMNVYFDAPSMQRCVAQNGLTALLRSPLAMGVLTGKFDAVSVLPADDIRSTNEAWRGYFRDARVMPDYLDRLEAVRELLQSGGRSLTQGALCWLLAKSDRNLPLPGARTVAQITENAGAISYGPLPDAVMAEIEGLMAREDEGPPRAR